MLNHIEIYVSDLEASRRFYKHFLGRLGYQLYQDWEQGFSLKQQNQYLVFVQAPQHFLHMGYHRTRIGLNHLAFEVEEDLEALRQDLLALGVPLLYEERFLEAEDPKALYCLDPDGIKLEWLKVDKWVGVDF